MEHITLQEYKQLQQKGKSKYGGTNYGLIR